MVEIRKVIIFRPGIANIGDEFITIGTEYVIKNVFGSGEKILKIYSPYGSSVFQSPLPFDTLRSIAHVIIPTSLREKLSYKVTRDSIPEAMNICKYLTLEDYDAIIVSGCFLTSYYVHKDLRFLLDIKDKIDILFIGVGGGSYSYDEIYAVESFLRKLKPKILVTRDSRAFQLYKDLAEHSYSGLDLAFYVSDAFEPPKLKVNYVIFNFDHHREPKINLPANAVIVRTHNSIKSIKKHWLKEKNFFISDNPYDYLTIIANAKEVHTDRVHTAVVATSYGVKWKFYDKTVRELILERVKNRDLRREKKEMIEFIKESIK